MTHLSSTTLDTIRNALNEQRLNIGIAITLQHKQDELIAEIGRIDTALAELKAQQGEVWEPVTIDEKPHIMSKAQFRGIEALGYAICKRTATAPQQQAEWIPIDYVKLAHGLEMHSDNIAITIGHGDTALATHQWPDDAEYAICRRPVGSGKAQANA